MVIKWASQVAPEVKNLLANEGDVRAVGSTAESRRSLEKEMATHSKILAWKIPWVEEPGGLQSMRPQRVRYNWATRQLRELRLRDHAQTKEQIRGRTRKLIKDYLSSKRVFLTVCVSCIIETMIISRAATNTYAYCMQGIVLRPLRILTHSIFIPIRCVKCCGNSYFLHTRKNCSSRRFGNHATEGSGVRFTGGRQPPDPSCRTSSSSPIWTERQNGYTWLMVTKWNVLYFIFISSMSGASRSHEIRMLKIISTLYVYL